jgi:hypothetical protein
MNNVNVKSKRNSVRCRLPPPPQGMLNTYILTLFFSFSPVELTLELSSPPGLHQRGIASLTQLIDLVKLEELQAIQLVEESKQVFIIQFDKQQNSNKRLRCRI